MHQKDDRKGNMHDSRYEKLADVLVQHSTRVQKGENVLIEAIDIPDEMVISLIREVRSLGGNPVITLKRNRIQRELIHSGSDDNIKLVGDYEAYRMKKMDAYIGVRGSLNVAEMSDVPTDAMNRYENNWLKPVHFDIRVPETKWVVLRWPTPSMAQQAGSSTEAFEAFYFDVCTLDYDKMARAMQPLMDRMDAADRVRIVSPGTDLTFSTGDIPVRGCAGEHNIPDGECYTAPVRDSVNGTIHYNTPTLYHGVTFTDICLTFRDGQIVEATANNSEKLNEILDTDEGARYIGEFAIGFNPHIHRPMLDILFDEKIAGSFHFTPGQAYEVADNGNRSSVHWDMVMIQTPEFGGGEIYLDDELIRKDGTFIVDDLKPLNPDQL
jgi:aminopeptidase